MKSILTGLLATLLVALSFYVEDVNSVAVMSVDLGSEWMKVAYVSPGVPMEIALNKESKRKTATMIAFREDERVFGEDAQIVAAKYPTKNFQYLVDLLGKSIDNPIVQLFKKRFPYYEIVADEERNTIAFKFNDGTLYTPELLLAQILIKSKEFAENSAGQKITETVITVPGYFNQAERKAMMQAADLAGIKVLQLINDYTAVALNYGIFHRKEINDTAHYIMFYDMGASSTTATIVSYQNVKTKDRGFVETSPQVSVFGVGYDRTLGGLEVQVRLQNYLATEFDKLKKTENSVFNNPRSMAKLFKEAGRVKNILSANADHFAQVESLLDDQDMKIHVTREKLEELCADLFERVTAPIKMALTTSVVLVGAGTRMPKIQEILTEFVGSDLSKNINTDEAAALGGVYRAADLSQGFKVTKFIIKDSVLFPIQIVFDKTNEEKGNKQVRRTLFGRMNSYPQKKIITFNKRKGDFSFAVNYADLDYLPAHEIEAIGSLNLSVINLSGVTEALEKHAKENAESKGIKAHFLMDDSGILNLVNVEAVAEKTITEVKDEGTLSKLGSTISQLFSGAEETDQVEKSEEPLKEDVKPVHEDPEQPAKPEDEKAKTDNETKSDDKTSNQTETKVEKKPTLTVLKEPISANQDKFGPQELTGNKLEASFETLRALEQRDKDKVKRETAQNNLESFVIDTLQYLTTEEYKKASTPEEVEEITKICQTTSDWLYEDGFDAPTDLYEQKLVELKEKTAGIYERVFEHRERPDVLAGMRSMLNGSNVFLTNMKNVQVRDIANKMALLDREVKYLVNKAKIWKPKQESVNQTEKSDTSKANETDSSSTTDSDEEVTFDTEDTDAKAAEEPVAPEDTPALPEATNTTDESKSEDKHIEL
ncbi:Similar to hyou1: Hypoxia up-regulated protein 1 (Danio rerio) [Cotesia congregata]|uniref:Hypoxia up-regulated protein 1 n=1 Tax=Cotesia congregata TaxID=51543 RepID=A0A8J2HI14_COTCN|nr:Similar to hyou1: Hypoxia up-regulated protein 1 (Danio rerio) [Cotesia congregata]